MVEGIIIIGLIIYVLYKERSHQKEIKKIKGDVQNQRDDAVKKSKAVIRGNLAQEFIPLFPDFPYNLSDAKFSGQPLDYIIFKGMSDVRDGLETDVEIVFADVKVNQAKRTKVQNAIKKAIEEKRVRFETWQIDENKQINIK